jgi:hypothetical protein
MPAVRYPVTLLLLLALSALRAEGEKGAEFWRETAGLRARLYRG